MVDIIVLLLCIGFIGVCIMGLGFIGKLIISIIKSIAGGIRMVFGGIASIFIR